MAKAEKQEFKWDTETFIGGYGDEKERHAVNICTLNGKTYIQDIKEVMTQKNGWKLTKRNTMPVDNFKELMHIFQEYENGSEEPASEVQEKEAPKKGLTAKHQAKDSAPSVLRGKKTSVREKIEANENFSILSKEKQETVIRHAEAIYEEYSKLSIGISKTTSFMVWEKDQLVAEKEIKNTKGFARAKITFIP